MIKVVKQREREEATAKREAAMLEKKEAVQKKRDADAAAHTLRIAHFESLTVEQQIASRVDRLLLHLAGLKPSARLTLADIQNLNSFERFKRQHKFNLNASAWIKKFRQEMENVAAG